MHISIEICDKPVACSCLSSHNAGSLLSNLLNLFEKHLMSHGKIRQLLYMSQFAVLRQLSDRQNTTSACAAMHADWPVCVCTCRTCI